jgi:hypothetical protein
MTVKTTEAIPVSPAFGENLMRPLNELIPAVTDVREFPGLLLGSPSLLSPLMFALVAPELIVMGNVPVAGPLFPAASVTDADSVHVPSVKVGSEQLVAEPAV